MDFETAKNIFNPDPAWWPARNSAEYDEIIALMKQSGATLTTDKVAAPLPPPLPMHYVRGSIVNPLNAPTPPEASKVVSKADFLSLSSNKAKFQTHLESARGSLSVQTLAPPPTAIPTAPPPGPISKQDFLRLGENAKYLKQHILYNKNVTTE